MEADHPPWKESEPGHARRLLALGEEELLAQADAEQGAAGNGDLADGVAEPGAFEVRGGLAEVAHTRHHHPVSPADLGRVGGQVGGVATRVAGRAPRFSDC